MTLLFEAAVAERGFDVALTVGPGETVAVMGPNGAGKSTLLSVVAGLLRPDSGRAELRGRMLFELPKEGGGGGGTWTAPHRRGTALLAQEPLLFPHLTALGNVAFGPRSAGASRRRAAAEAERWLAAVEAQELRNRHPDALSGGQAQRVAVARALAADPGLLLLDEPMAALDIHSAPLLRRLLRRVLADRSALIITHDVLDALMLADRVVILENGRVSESGPVRDVLQRPRSPFAAGLAGLNLLSGTLTAAGLQTAEGQIITGHLVDGVDITDGTDGTGGAGVAVFPPSAVSVFLDDAHGSPRNSFEAAITDLEPHGDLIRVRAGSLAADITPAASADLGLVPGLQVHFVVKAAAVAVYPA